MRVVVALGGNALLRRHEDVDVATQRRNVATAVRALVDLSREHQIVVTHGNGPQVGLLALQAAAFQAGGVSPLDVLGAESEGLIGYLLDQEFTSALPDRLVATLLTQVVVDASDPAFARPTKPIGPFYDSDAADRLSEQRGWVFCADGDQFRRVVPSPEPRRVIELPTIRLLVEHNVIVICSGGGGIPVTVDESRRVHGVEAVIDKDLSAAMLAQGVGADALLLLTDVDAVYTDFGSASARRLAAARPDALRRLHLNEGSMGPKVEAGSRFVEAAGGIAAIGALGDAAAVLRGSAGTTVRIDGPPLSWR